MESTIPETASHRSPCKGPCCAASINIVFSFIPCFLVHLGFGAAAQVGCCWNPWHRTEENSKPHRSLSPGKLQSPGYLFLFGTRRLLGLSVLGSLLPAF